MALVGTMVLGLPLQSYADPQLDILLNIATQARDNLGLTISQTNNVSDEINQLYKQGSDETDQLAKAVSQQDVESAKQHFLAAMKFFKETSDKINSLNATASNDQQKAEITQLRGEIVRLNNMENLLKTIATKNNIEVDFTKFDGLIQTAQQDLESGNVNDAITLIKNANDFLVETHNSLTTIAKERTSARAKDFTERQIERFSKMSGFNATSSTIQPPTQPIQPHTQTIPSQPPVTENTTGTNATSSTIPPPISPTSPENTTGTNASSTTISPSSTVQNNVNVAIGQNPEEMLAELKKLVSEGKVNEALKVIKMIEQYQNEKSRMSEKMEQLSSTTNNPSLAENSNNTFTPPISPPPIQPPVTENTTGTNATSSTIPPPISPTSPENTTGTNASST
ncbi:MAG: hypothetical protein ACREAN_04560, partial [Nitrosopumilaceae archaeon]